MARKLKVLVVDDEQIVLDSVKRHLRNDNYELFFVLKVKDAFQCMKEENIDIILTDLMMPEIDGLEFMKQLNEDGEKIPVIMITGYATISTALQATQLGAFDYIAKPFTKAELRAVVNRASDLVFKSDSLTNNNDQSEENDLIIEGKSGSPLRSIGEYSWVMTQKDSSILIGVERKFLHVIGKIQTVYLPSVGEKIRQGAVFFQLFSSDMRSHALLSPLSGEVLEVNNEVLTDPNDTLKDPYGTGWLVVIRPTNFEEERKLLGL